MTSLYTVSLFLWGAILRYVDCVPMMGSPFMYDNLKHGKTMELDGQVIFGGLFPMHEKGPQGTNCGPLKEDKGIQRLEAMMYAVDLLNGHSTILPNITVGVHILDTCSRDTYALEQSMDFIKSHISNLDVSEFTCPNGRMPTYKPTKPVVGVIGAASSQVSIMVANVLRLFKIPQISYASTSIELSDKSRFEYFSRVVPPDTLQAQAMVDIATSLGWSYVCTVADEGNYGEKGIAAFEELAKKNGICIAKGFKIPREAILSTFDGIISGLSDTPNANGVIMFANEDNTRRLLRAKSDTNNTKAKELYFLASDSWGAKAYPVEEQEDAALGAITMLPKREVLNGFDEYFLSRNLTNNDRNPWWKEFWEQHFHCTLNNVTTTWNVPLCTGKESLAESVYPHEQEGLVQFVVDAVLALAHAIQAIQKDKCGAIESKLCEEFVPTRGQDLLGYIHNVSFVGSGGTNIRFNKNGDGPGTYNIFQYQQISHKEYKYIPIGDWADGLNINLSLTHWPGIESGTPKSICSEQCQKGFARSTKGDSCCWICIPCMEYQVLADTRTCKDCPYGQKPNTNKSRCQALPTQHMELATAWAIIPMCFSVIGILLTISVTSVFTKYNNTPVVKASGRELCYALLTGILLCYGMTFVLVSKPNIASCALLRIGLGTSLAICYSSIFTKTNRISRIFNRGVQAMVKRPGYTSPRSQLFICTTLVSVQVIGVVAWLVIDHPQTVTIYPSRDTVILRCGASDTAQALSLLYNMVLIVLCTLYAFKTRNMPENFNEAKWIAFSMYSTCIVWLAYLAIFIGTGSSDFRIRITTLCMCTSISATIILGCLFAPKIYIVLLQPGKNIRKTNSTMLRGSDGEGKSCRSLFSSGKRALVGGGIADLTSPSMSNVTDISLISNEQCSVDDKE